MAQRWTDEMLDKLADKVDKLSDKVDNLADKVDKLSDKVDKLADKVDDNAEQMQIMAIAINRLTESNVEYRQWKQETDQRFNILLEEVRASNRRIDLLENR